MNALQCEKCGQALALADAQCSVCHTPIPVAQRMAVLLPRAEALAEQERYAEAARSVDNILALDLDVPQKKLLGRKKAAWLRKAALAQPQLLDGAEAALAEVLRLDDNDDLSHQVWIDLLVQRGYGEKARAWYQQRLDLNADDAMAKRQMSVLKLAADFKVQPVKVSSALADTEPKFFLWKLIKPTPLMMATMAVFGVISVAFWAHSLGNSPAPVAVAAAADPELATITDAAGGGLGDLWKIIDTPGNWAFNALVSIAYVVWGIRRKKRG